MKKIINAMLAAVMLLAAGCKKESMEPVGNWAITAPTPTSPAPSTTLVLNEALPSQAIAFAWTPATTSNQFVIGYTVVLDSADNADFSSPILTLVPGNSGKDLTVSVTAKQLDYALSVANYPANGIANLKWGVIARAIEKTAVAEQPISIKRFATEIQPTTLYIAGSGTETGTDVTKATPMRARKDANGDITNIFDAYLTLTAGGKYKFYSEQLEKSLTWGGSGTTLAKGGPAFAAPTESGQYRVTVNLNDNSVDLLKIDRWSIVGDAIVDGWGGDAPLEYKGNGLWQASIDLVKPSDETSFIFRANGDWGWIIKRITGTTSQVLMENEAGDAGKSVENVPISAAGKFIVTLNLAASQYSYSVEKDPNAPAAIEAPEELYLVSDGAQVAKFNKDGKVFSSGIFIALDKSKTYSFNSKADGSGTSYTVNNAFGMTGNPTADAVNGNFDLSEAATEIAVETSQAYTITVNFETLKVAWKYYNMKLFHWDDPNGGWDARNEYVMTYTDPYTFTVTAAITANFDLKFNSPWDVQFGKTGGGLSGTMTNGGANFTGVTESGTYKATIVVAPDYSTCTYTFVKQ